MKNGDIVKIIGSGEPTHAIIIPSYAVVKGGGENSISCIGTNSSGRNISQYVSKKHAQNTGLKIGDTVRFYKNEVSKEQNIYEEGTIKHVARYIRVEQQKNGQITHHDIPFENIIGNEEDWEVDPWGEGWD